jgi:hypothetical protein
MKMDFKLGRIGLVLLKMIRTLLSEKEFLQNTSLLKTVLYVAVCFRDYGPTLKPSIAIEFYKFNASMRRGSRGSWS